MRVPANAVAGKQASISTSGSGDATFYLAGPSRRLKQKVHLGDEIQVRGDDFASAGWYLAVLCVQECKGDSFYVAPGDVSSFSFLVHPSRVPVAQNGVISGVAILWDKNRNLVLSPLKVQLQLGIGASDQMSTTASTREGMAWFRANSGSHAGAVRATLSLNDISISRVVQQVASDPCSLRLKAQRTTTGIIVETEPVKDCSGNPLPDGTIVTFTGTGAHGRATVDAPIKQGVARAQMLASGPVTISAASGVVVGNDLHVE